MQNVFVPFGMLKLSVVVVFLCGAAVVSAAAADAGVIYQSRFADKAADWTAQGKATLSDVSRTADGHSLKIQQQDDADQNSHWLSPALKTPGGPVTVSFWAADNYLRMTDGSYAATVELVFYDDAGKQTGETRLFLRAPWDPNRKASMFGLRTQAGLKWKYYERSWTPTGKTFRLKFCWPKPIVRGECYLTDVQVRSGASVRGAAATSKAAASDKPARLVLELNSPANGHFYYVDDPLRMDAVLYSTDKKPVGDHSGMRLDYEVTDFEHFFIARGSVPFAPAKPLRSPPGFEPLSKAYRVNTRYAHNVSLPLYIEDAKAKQPGREFFLEAKLWDGDTLIASDTVPYAFVRTLDSEKYPLQDSRFIWDADRFGNRWTESKHAHQTMADKVGMRWSHVLDYYWVREQPNYPGPITFKSKLGHGGRRKVTWCPNIEQERTNPAWIKSMVPPECIIPDPQHKGRTTFKIDPYVEYIVAKLAHNLDGIGKVIPSGLERQIDARTIELHKKAYTAIKKRWPEMPVGMMLYGLPMNPSADVDIFIKHELYNYVDFLDTHIYASSVDWSEWQRLQRFYRNKLKREPPPLISTEFSRVGGNRQIEKSRDMIASHVEAFANGMDQIYYFNTFNYADKLAISKPFLREAPDFGNDQTGSLMTMQMVYRARSAETLWPTADDPAMKTNYHFKNKRYWGALRSNTMPLLQTVTYANLIHHLDYATFHHGFQPSPETVCYVFERDGRTRAVMWMTKPLPPQAFVIEADVPYVVEDMLGRQTAITPLQGKSLLSVDANPVFVTFDKQVVLFDRKQKIKRVSLVEGGLASAPIARGTKADLNIELPNLWQGKVKAKVSATVDGTWPQVKDKKIKMKGKAATRQALSVAVDIERQVGTYPLVALVTHKDAPFAYLKAPLQVEELLLMTVSGVPMTPTQAPGIEVQVTNLKSEASSGTVGVTCDFFGQGMQPDLLSVPYRVKGKATTRVVIPLGRDQVNLSTAYDIKVTLRETDGIVLQRDAEVAFRATPKAPGTITIDGDLSDWQLDKQVAVPFTRFWRGGVEGVAPTDLSGQLYTAWDADHLYFAVTVKDQALVSRHNDVDLWTDDNIMLGLYPWGWQVGDALKGGYYRAHLGRCKDGTARIFRIGNPEGGRTDAQACPIAVKQTADGYIYEWAYPREYVTPMALRAGSRFRLSMMVMDTDPLPDGKFRRCGVQIGGFNENIDARPIRWREFILTD
jgi:hypothetical protein